MLLGVMLASLIMSATLPEAFGDRGLFFAGAYVAMQVGRSVFAVAALRPEPQLRRNFQRILAWSVASGVLWLTGGLVPGTAREALWLLAVVVDYTAPASGFFTPGLGRSRTTDWTITGTHLAERFQLFLIIALGESILVTGATFGGLRFSAAVVAAFAVAFVDSVALWWVYFDRAAEDSSEAIGLAGDPGRLGRSAYTYFHVPMVAGIIVTAVADELTIAHPGGRPKCCDHRGRLGRPGTLSSRPHPVQAGGVRPTVSLPPGRDPRADGPDTGGSGWATAGARDGSDAGGGGRRRVGHLDRPARRPLGTCLRRREKLGCARLDLARLRPPTTGLKWLTPSRALWATRDSTPPAGWRSTVRPFNSRWVVIGWSRNRYGTGTAVASLPPQNVGETSGRWLTSCSSWS